MKPYAEKADLEALLPVDMNLPDDAEVDRLLAKASDRMDALVTEYYEVDATDMLPTDALIAADLKRATCLQVIFMLKAGEDIEGVGGSQVSVGTFSGVLPGRFSPDAYEVLQNGGLINGPGRRWLIR